MGDCMRTIEVSGVKFDVDMRTARKIDTYKVGDRVKVLVKNYSGYTSYPGAIVAIDAFKNLPTVVIAYVPNVFGNDGKVEFAHLNENTKDVEICPMVEDDIVPTRQTVIKYFNESIAKKQQEIREIETRKEFFLRQYGVAFGNVAADTAAPSA